ncbi:hypothetical protein B0H13DRAFT_2568099 [Mycena leptocephala]|nr:hypothetical protein B0H13DRAFT_2568099 [Mycena leptocephala]
MAVLFSGSRQRARLCKKKRKLRHFGLARRLRSPHIGSGYNSPRQTSSFPRRRQRRTVHSGAASVPRNLPMVAAASAPGRTRRRAGCDELGSAITLPKMRRRRDWLGWPQRCGAVSRGPGGDDFGGAGGQARQEGDGAVMGGGARDGAISIGGGSGQDWSEGRGEERAGNGGKHAH